MINQAQAIPSCTDIDNDEGGDNERGRTLEVRAVPCSQWSLEVMGHYGVQRFTLSEGEEREVGSAPSSPIRIDDPTVSARHCRVGVVNGCLVWEDLGSRNGLFAAGARVLRATVDAAGCIVVGRAVVTCSSLRSEGGEEDLIKIPPLEGVLGQSIAMRRVARDVRRLAPLRASVLIRGETGTGKELIAQAFHRLGRPSKPMVALNMGALPGELADAELFGHERGAFTGAVASRPGAFESARGGTLFLDEIAELQLPVQAKLLRALEGGEIRALGAGTSRRIEVRVIAATWASLEGRVAEGAFREDLYHRLAVFTVTLPPLRERGGDIALLAADFLTKSEVDVGRHQLSPGAMSRLVSHSWPGNVRELRNVLLRAALYANGVLISAEHIQTALAAGMITAQPTAAVSKRDRRAEVRAVLTAHNGNVSGAARALGIARSTVRAWTK